MSPNMALNTLERRPACSAFSRRRASRPFCTSRPVPVQCHAQSAGRREVLQLGVALPLLLAGQPAFAGPATEAAPAAAVRPAPAPAASIPGMASQPYLDVDFQLLPPSAFNFIDTQPAYDPDRRGPAPEPSPVRVRYDSPDGNTVLSVLVRNAQNLKQSILQTTDISGLGSLEEAAKLLLPRGSRVVAGSVLQVALPPRQTALGPVEIPPKNYYRYELTTPNGLHVIMSVAAQKGRIYVCGGSTLEGEVWERDAPVLRAATESFRLRLDGATL